jgi:DNA-binding response OmpR family regulator
MTMDRQVPLVVIASEASALADSVATQLRHEGYLVYVTHSADGCLRVATSVRPDIILLDPRLPARLERLLKAHPVSASARILHLSAESVLEAQHTLPHAPAA